MVLWNLGLLLLLAMLIVHMLVGWKLGRATHDLPRYVLTDGKVSAFGVASSLLATILGASAVIGVCGLAMTHGWTALIWLGAGVFGLLALSFLIDRVDLKSALSLPQVLDKQGGRSMRLISAWVILPAWIGIIAAQFAAFGRLTEALQPGSFYIMTAVMALAVIGYVGFAGQQGVIRTDRVQIGMILLLLLALAFTLLWSPPQPLFQPSLQKPLQPLSPVRLLDIGLAVAFPFLIGPDIFSRMLTLRSARQRGQSLRYTALGLAISACLIVGIGVAAREWISAEEAEQVLIHLPELLWGSWGGIVAALALAAVILSSADTCLLSAATILTVDVFGKESLRTTRIGVVSLGIASLFIAWWLGGVIKTLLLAYTIYTSGLAVPAIAALFLHRPLPKYTLMLTISAGAATGIYLRLTEQPFGLPLALGVSTLIAVFGSYLEKKNAPASGAGR